MRSSSTTFRLDLTAIEGGDGTGGGKAAADEATKVYKDLLAKHSNDAGTVAVLLANQTYELREKNRELRGKVPPDGAVVITGDEAAAWVAYLKLGKPADLAAAIAERNQFKADLDANRKAELVRDAAEIAGFKATVLTTLVKAEGCELTIGKPDAKGARSVTVKDGDKDVPLADYAESQWKDHLPALRADTARPPGTPGRDMPPAIPGRGDAVEDRARSEVLARGRYTRL